MSITPTGLNTNVGTIKKSRGQGTQAGQNKKLVEALKKDPIMRSVEDRLVLKEASPEAITRAQNKISAVRSGKPQPKLKNLAQNITHSEPDVIRQTVGRNAKDSFEVFEEAGLTKKIKGQDPFRIVNKPGYELTGADKLDLRDAKKAAKKASDNAIARQNQALSTLENNAKNAVQNSPKPATQDTGWKLKSAEDLIDERAAKNAAKKAKPNAARTVTKNTGHLTPAQQAALNKPGALRTAEDLVEINHIKPDAFKKPGVLRTAEDLIDINYAKRTPNTISNTTSSVQNAADAAAQAAKAAEQRAVADALKKSATLNPNAPLQLGQTVDAAAPGFGSKPTQIIETYAEGYAKNHPAVKKPSLWSRSKGKLPKKPGWLKSFGNWYNGSIRETGIYKGIAKTTNNVLAKGAAQGSETFIGSTSKFLQKAVGKMGQVAEIGIVREIGKTKLLSRGNLLVGMAFESFDLIEAYKEGLGRGIAQTVQSGTKVGVAAAASAAAVAGAITLGVISGPVGWGALAIGAVAGMAGYKVGDILTGWLGKNQKGLFDKPQSTPQLPPAPKPFGTVTQSTTMSYPYDLNDPLGDLPRLY